MECRSKRSVHMYANGRHDNLRAIYVNFRMIFVSLVSAITPVPTAAWKKTAGYGEEGDYAG
jgi:hypothetical protein